MYAIIQTGSKQYRVKKGDVIDVELLCADEESSVEFKNILFVNNEGKIHVGSPYLSKFFVKGDLLEQNLKGPKVISYKFKRRKNYHRKIGHRQKYSRVKITEIGSVS